MGNCGARPMAADVPQTEAVPPQKRSRVQEEMPFLLWTAFLFMSLLFGSMGNFQFIEGVNYIQPALNMTDSEWTNIIGLPGNLAMGLMQMIFAGEVIDTLHRPRLLGCVLLVEGGIIALVSAVRSYGALLSVRIIYMMVAAFNQPLITGIAASRFSDTRLGVATAFIITGNAFCDGIALALVSATQTDWELPFVINAILLCIPGTIALCLPEVQKSRAGLKISDAFAGLLRSYRVFLSAFLSIPSLWALFGFAVCFGFMTSVVGFIQLWLTHERGVTAAHASSFVSTVGLTGAPILLFAVGVLASYLRPKGVPWFLTSGILQAVAGVNGILMVLLPVDCDNAFFWMLVTLNQMFIGVNTSVLLNGIFELTPPAVQGSCIGLFIGAGFASAGILTSTMGNALTTWTESDLHLLGRPGAYSLVILIIWCLATLGVPFNFFIARRMERDTRAFARHVMQSESLLQHDKGPAPAVDKADVEYSYTRKGAKGPMASTV